ncbi:uncharacterized protein EKO05_0010450 [Ascochyta rabiei]|uniref:uncharacterized protein n=1 Tax=Didymella rabiei TaxID=5454 RepID=UPI0018FF71E9|nr:uncharacterized protein EKO05_0010450 [Ascochyta rabiei]UPX20210.1 hypothetical protein EKO05_0010450 [Ascochyta rabiei]
MSIDPVVPDGGQNGNGVEPPPQSFDDNAEHVEFGSFDHSEIPLEKEEWPVIIIGSSMVGMMTGLLLGYHGIKSISFDSHAPSGTHPRAAGLNYRTVEILRQLGLDKLAQAESAKEFDVNAGMLVVEKIIGGKVIAQVQEKDAEIITEVTPGEGWLWITQAMFEPLLRANAGKFGCTQLYGRLVVHYEEDEDGVLVVVKDLNNQEYKKYRAKYLVACDGNRSSTRVKEGIKLSGAGVLRNSLSLRITGDMSPHLGTRSVHGVIYVLNSNISGGFRLENQGQSAIVMVNRAGDKNDFPKGSVTPEEARKYVYDLSGLPEDMDLSIAPCSYWTMTSYVADRLQSRRGRVFIAGDAAHTMPPTGGLGGNTGVADAHNLAWKLAFVLKGLASTELLETYSRERQAIDAFVVDQATRRFYNRVDHVQPPVEEEADLDVELGARYADGATVGADKSVTKPFENILEPSGGVGCRFPHVWLSGSQTRISTLDLVKQKLVLVAAEPQSPWIAAAEKLPVSHVIDSYELHKSSAPWQDAEGKVRVKCQLQPGEALLVRPDGFIAWRSRTNSKNDVDQVSELQGVLHQLLGIR